MEYPHLGNHCFVSSCNKLDFLPFQCTGCHNTFCDEHWRHDNHNCVVQIFEDYQSFTCPVCKNVVRPQRNENPNIAMEAHIASGCKKNKVRKARPNQCSASGCKVKEVVPMMCDKCNSNFCLRHRHPADHHCKASPSSSKSTKPSSSPSSSSSSRALQQQMKNKKKGASSATSRTNHSHNKQGIKLREDTKASQISSSSQWKEFTPRTTSLNGGLSEDEALALAVQQSQQRQQSHQQQHQQHDQQQQQNMSEEEAIQLAIQQSLMETNDSINTNRSHNRQNHHTNKHDNNNNNKKKNKKDEGCLLM
eukprot:m.135999 g.135999  ORF g.135999 m.135999 type:complete len:306 (-) comp10347_c0_seq1:210-1127(-)